MSDDILIFGKSQHEHDVSLKRVLQTLSANGLTINPQKCEFSTDTIKFFGFIFTSQGYHPDPTKVQAILQLKEPMNTSQVRSFRGMIQHIARFIPHLSNKMKPFNDLTKKQAEANFEWTKELDDNFRSLKEEAAKPHKLAYFDPKKKTILHVDAGPHGVGAILSQQGKRKQLSIIAYASHTLSPTQQRYSQIEKETYAAIWAIKHIYLYGSDFTLFTDHKPLISILNNPRSSPSARIERLLLSVQGYSFKTEFQPGSTNPADYLSRNPMKDNTEDSCEGYVRFIIHSNTPKRINIEEIQEATENDDTLQSVIQALKNTKESAWKHAQLKPFAHVKHQLTHENNILLKEHQIVIPSTLQDRVIQLAHKGHLGIVKTKQLIRSKVWFPNMNVLVENHIKKCHTCQVVTPTNRRDPIRTISKACYPFQHIDIDYAGPFPNNKYYILLIDELSKFPIVKQLPSTNFKHLRCFLDETFSIFGFPEELKHDNGPPFNGEDLKQYLQALNVRDHPTTPYWPEANGLVERFVKTFKKSLLCAIVSNENIDQQIHDFLLSYRSAPHPSTGLLPSTVMFIRETNNFIPSIRKSVKVDYSEIITREKKKRRTQNEQANARRHTTENTFNIGDLVLCKQRKKNSFTPYFDPVPYTITKITGSQIQAQRHRQLIIRNSSFFKHYNVPTPPRIQKQSHSPTHTHPSPPCTSKTPSSSNRTPEGPQLNENTHPWAQTPPQITNPRTPEAVVPPSTSLYGRTPPNTSSNEPSQETAVDEPASSTQEPPTPRRPARQRRPPKYLDDFSE